jgi:hypothetical protein
VRLSADRPHEPPTGTLKHRLPAVTDHRLAPVTLTVTLWAAVLVDVRGRAVKPAIASALFVSVPTVKTHVSDGPAEAALDSGCG